MEVKSKRSFDRDIFKFKFCGLMFVCWGKGVTESN